MLAKPTRSSCSIALAVLAATGCDDFTARPELEESLPNAAEAGPQPGASALTRGGAATPSLPGFDVDVSVDGDDVVLDWSASGPQGTLVRVFRSTDVDALSAGTLPGPGVEEIVLPAGATSFVDVGAADHEQATPTIFYRVEVDGAVSTMLMKISTAMAPGYNKLGLCMLDGPSHASDVAAELGTSVTAVWSWNAVDQSYSSWDPSQGVGTAADYALPLGSVVAVQVDGSTPAYQSLVGTVPTSEAFVVSGAPGDNWSVLPVRYDGPTSASYWVDVIGYEGVGVWNNLTQSATWYWGSGNDFDIEPCRPYHTYLSEDACTSNADCAAGSLCSFDDAAACGTVAAGACQARPIDCELAPVGEVCGCDGTTYPSACEAELAGVDVADDQGGCPQSAPVVYDALADFNPGPTGNGDNGWHYLYDTNGTGNYEELAVGTNVWGFTSWTHPTCREAILFLHPGYPDSVLVHTSSCGGWTTLAWEAPSDGTADLVMTAAENHDCSYGGVAVEIRDDSDTLLWSQYDTSMGVTYEYGDTMPVVAGQRVYLRVNQGPAGPYCDSTVLGFHVDFTPSS